jgi:cellulose synthase operon protein C
MRAVRIQPGEQQAAYVLARLELATGETRRAVQVLEAAIQQENPHDRALALLAGLRLQESDFAEAERLYRLGADRFPLDANWLKSLSRVFLKSSDQHKLSRTLAELVERDPENPLLYKKLLELALDAGDYQQAVRWAQIGLEIDVMDADFHTGMAEATKQLGRSQPAEDDTTRSR